MSWRCLSGLALALALLLSVPAGASPFDPNTDRRTATDYRTPRIQPPPPCPGALPVPGRHGQSTAAPGLWAISGKRTFARAYVYVGRGPPALPDGRSRGAQTDVRRYPVADRPATGAARVGMRGGEVKVQRATEGEACLDAGQSARASLPVPARARFDRLFVPTRHDLPLPKPFRGAILPSKLPGTWRMSVKTPRGARHKWDTLRLLRYNFLSNARLPR
jgi:hypothetical protein